MYSEELKSKLDFLKSLEEDMLFQKRDVEAKNCRQLYNDILVSFIMGKIK